MANSATVITTTTAHTTLQSQYFVFDEMALEALAAVSKAIVLALFRKAWLESKAFFNAVKATVDTGLPDRA
jgi:hypothetical protein